VQLVKCILYMYYFKMLVPAFMVQQHQHSLTVNLLVLKITFKDCRVQLKINFKEVTLLYTIYSNVIYTQKETQK